ncbi:hypothetical protein NR798_16175 [Archangium gephyra]|uniref:hypothetical protein n=1 Tax=Archangium gephyra TaxID=48 RepID=UPI0035D42A32
MSHPHSRSTLALLAACALLMSACGAESQQEGPSEPLGESQKGLVDGQQVKIRCDSGNCANGQERCMYVEPTTLANGNPAVFVGACFMTVGRDARYHWTTFYNSATNAWRLQNHATFGCLHVDYSTRRLVTVACNSALLEQNWQSVPSPTAGVTYLKSLANVSSCAHPYFNNIAIGTPMHDWQCGADLVQDWNIEPLF